MKRHTGFFYSVFFCFFASLFSSNIYASSGDQTVSPRIFPEYNPLQISINNEDHSSEVVPKQFKPTGFRAGKYVFFPKIHLTESFADNIFFSDRSKKSDFISIISPSFQMQSDWSNHEVNFYSMMDIGKYANNSSENFLDYKMGADARVFIKKDLYISAEFFFSKSHQLRGTPESNEDSSSPTLYFNLNPSIGIYKRFNRFFVSANALLNKYDFKSDSALNGNVINNDFQERTRYQSSINFGYDFKSDYSAFLRGVYTKRDYISSKSSTFVNRDSTEVSLEVGTVFDIKKYSLSGNAQLGVISREFSSHELSDFTDLTFRIDLSWKYSRRLSFNTIIAREIQETTQASVNSILSSIFKYEVDYELQHNWFVNYNFAAIKNKFRGLSRVDKIIIHEINTKYYLDKTLYFSANYNFAKNNSPSLDFKINMFSVGLGLSY